MPRNKYVPVYSAVEDDKVLYYTTPKDAGEMVRTFAADYVCEDRPDWGVRLCDKGKPVARIPVGQTITLREMEINAGTIAADAEVVEEVRQKVYEFSLQHLR